MAGSSGRRPNCRWSPLNGGNLITDNFTEARFGVDNKLRGKLRLELYKAGFFGQDAIRYYVFFRFFTVIIFPCIVFAVSQVTDLGLNMPMTFLAVAVAAGIGILAPDAYLSRRQKSLQQSYRLIFPDLLDLLVVCVTAGLSLEASFERIRGQMSKQNVAIGRNLELMGAEIRAGQRSGRCLPRPGGPTGSPAEPLLSLRLCGTRWNSAARLLRDLRVYSEELRAKRMLRAEETANALAVKMVIPLAAGIFPVVLIIVLLPIMLSLVKVMIG